jgi:hypothetical protein
MRGTNQWDSPQFIPRQKSLILAFRKAKIVGMVSVIHKMKATTPSKRPKPMETLESVRDPQSVTVKAITSRIMYAMIIQNCILLPENGRTGTRMHPMIPNARRMEETQEEPARIVK